MRPPHSAVVPAVISGVARLNSLIGILNPKAAKPAPVTMTPKINKIADIRLYRHPTDVPRSMRADEAATDNYEFWPASVPTAMTNVTIARPNPTFINESPPNCTTLRAAYSSFAAVQAIEGLPHDSIYSHWPDTL
jgi:hypothetical protein